MIELSPCPACRRHVAVTEAACPFCAASLVPITRELHTLAGRLSRAALFAGALTASACSSNGAPRQDPAPPPLPPPADPAVARDAAVAATDAPAAAGSGSIRGRVLVDGQPRPYIAVSVVHATTGQAASAQSDMQGAYVIDGLDPGEYRLTARLTNERRPPIEQRVTVRAGEATTVDLAAVHAHRSIKQPYGAPPARRRVV